LPIKTKQQARQEKRLAAAKKQAKRDRADLKAMSGKKAPPRKKSGRKPSDGFFDGLMKKIFGRRDKPRSAQQSIPYREMHRDGICRVSGGLYTKTIAFQDINYQLAQNDDKTQIFENYCDFLNYFDSTIHVQLSFINQYGNLEEFQRNIEIPDQNDGFDNSRREYSGMLKNQLAKGNNGLVKTKYITFGIEADNLKAAKPRLERIEADMLNNFKALGVKARSLNGLERLEILHGQFHPDGKEKLWFKWGDIPKTGLSTKDYIAPTSFDFREGKTFRMGTTIGAVSFVQILAPELSDRMLADFLDMDSAVTVNLHIQGLSPSQSADFIEMMMGFPKDWTV